jgi:general secretion pathway protein J
MTRGGSKAAGFTLLEVLIAIAVFAVFSTMAYGGLIRLLDSRDRVESERAFWRGTALAFVRIQQDLAAAVNRPVRDNAGTQVWAFRGQPVDARALGEPSVELTRAGVMLTTATSSDLQRVAYRFEEGKLLRISWPVLDRAPQTKPIATPMLQNVEDFQVRFNNGDTWLDSWPPLPGSTPGPPLPAAVEMKITLKGRGSYTRTFLVGTDK